MIGSSSSAASQLLNNTIKAPNPLALFFEFLLQQNPDWTVSKFVRA